MSTPSSFASARLIGSAFWLAAGVTFAATCSEPDAPAPVQSERASSGVAVNAADLNAAAKQRQDFGVGTLWSVTSITGAESHILGTLHIGSERELAVPAQVWSALKSARRLIVEVDLGALTAAQAAALQRLPREADWEHTWSRADLAKLRRRLAANGEAYAEFGRIRPWVLVNAMTVGPDVPAQSLDDVIIARARSARMDVLPMETMEQQFAAFDCASTAEHLLLLQDALAMAPSEFETLNREVLALYAQQRVADLVVLQESRFPRGPQAREIDARLTRCAIEDRSERFLVQLDNLLQEPGQFVAVGAAHLIGDRGLLERLRERGFQVERAGVLPAAHQP